MPCVQADIMQNARERRPPLCVQMRATWGQRRCWLEDNDNVRPRLHLPRPHVVNPDGKVVVMQYDCDLVL